mgnify:CR=1 FL=1
MTFAAQIITLYPDMFPGPLGHSLAGRAREEGIWSLDTIQLRDFATDKHRTVDDTPAGGGAGMVLRADVLEAAINDARGAARGVMPIYYLSPRGKRIDQEMARNLATADGVTLLCGRFEGVDERVLEHFNIQEISLGDFVMTGGELAAQALIDATVRLLPGVLGNADSAVEESFSQGMLEHPQYTKPAVWNDRPIPEVLQSGNHKKIAEWRRDMSDEITKTRRPDLWEAHQKSDPKK